MYWCRRASGKKSGLKNYEAAAVGVTKFLPLHDKVLAEIGREINRELKAYSKDPTNIYKYREDLEKLADFRNDHLVKDIATESSQVALPCFFVLSKEQENKEFV